MEENTITKEISFKGFEIEEYQDVLTNEAQLFLLELHENFNQRRLKLLEEREVEQAYFDAGNYPSFPEEKKKLENPIGFVRPYQKIY
jgi:malate synthase